jgi:hypothetical protein
MSKDEHRLRRAIGSSRRCSPVVAAYGVGAVVVGADRTERPGQDRAGLRPEGFDVMTDVTP